MTDFDWKSFIRPNIVALKPYVCARDIYTSGLFLDANENSYGPCLDQTQNGPIDSKLVPGDLHRYPSPNNLDLKQSILTFKGYHGLKPENVFFGVGSDEIIDMIMRVSCTPAEDAILVCSPTYGMYKVTAAVNDVNVVDVSLKEDFSVQLDKIEKSLEKNPSIKLIFIPTPGNPTSIIVPHEDIKSLVAIAYRYNVVVVLDEAYVDFCGNSCAMWVNEKANLCVMQTVSKGFGLAAIRLGLCYAHPDFIAFLNKAKAPYNISALTAHLLSQTLTPSSKDLMTRHIGHIMENKPHLMKQISSLPGIIEVLRSDANFFLARIGSKGKSNNDKAKKVQERLATEDAVVVRFRGNEMWCEGCLRITVGTVEMNDKLVNGLQRILTEMEQEE